MQQIEFMFSSLHSARKIPTSTEYEITEFYIKNKAIKNEFSAIFEYQLSLILFTIGNVNYINVAPLFLVDARCKNTQRGTSCVIQLFPSSFIMEHINQI